MKAIFTGMNGTVAPFVANYFSEKGYEVIAYDRNIVSTENEREIEPFILRHQPKILLHFAMGSIEWTKNLSLICSKKQIEFVYISTVSVFSNENRGPHTIDSIPDADDDYGRYKRMSESVVLNNHTSPYIIRLGWQIGYGKGQNQMIDFLYRKMAEEGEIKASSLWYPATSFLQDTASAIYQIVHELKPGLYHVNSNDQYTYYEIVQYLSKIYAELTVVETKDFNADHRMIDERVKIRKLSEIFNGE